MGIKLLNVLKKEITEQGGKFKGMTLPSGEKSGDVIGAIEFDNSGKFVDYIDPKDVGKRELNSTTVVDVDSPDLYNGIPGNRVYGMRKHPIYGDMRMHLGIDFSNGGMNDAYVIITDGEVLNAVNDRSKSGCGTSVKIKHPDGNCTRVCHLEKLFVSKGDTIKAGTVVGLVGNTGGSKGAHLHWEYGPNCAGASNPPDGSWNNYFRFSKKINPQINKIETKIINNQSSNIQKNLPSDVKNAIDKLKTKWGVNITQSHIDKELAQEGSTRPDNGGVNSEAEQKIKKLISDCNTKFGNLGGVVSGYRSYSDQVDNFGKKVKNDGRTIEDVQSSNTIPGFSQHHTGKAFDIFSVDPYWWDSRPNVKKWVSDNSSKYGFEITYKTNSILRIAEPWHLYYVGGGSSNKTEDTLKSTNSINGSSYIIDLNNPDSKVISLIWGGTPSSSYGSDFMKKQGEPYFGSKNIIYSNHDNSLSKIREIIKKELGSGYTIKSVSGFSKGGEKTWDEINSGYSFIGLIDPSTSFARTTLPSNVKMMSNNTNWKSYPGMMKAIKTMEDSGLSERIGNSTIYNHLGIPKIFFEKYSSNY